VPCPPTTIETPSRSRPPAAVRPGPPSDRNTVTPHARGHSHDRAHARRGRDRGQRPGAEDVAAQRPGADDVGGERPARTGHRNGTRTLNPSRFQQRRPLGNKTPRRQATRRAMPPGNKPPGDGALPREIQPPPMRRHMS
jgi:hypothetical protein